MEILATAACDKSGDPDVFHTCCNRLQQYYHPAAPTTDHLSGRFVDHQGAVHRAKESASKQRLLEKNAERVEQLGRAQSDCEAAGGCLGEIPGIPTNLML